MQLASNGTSAHVVQPNPMPVEGEACPGCPYGRTREQKGKTASGKTLYRGHCKRCRDDKKKEANEELSAPAKQPRRAEPAEPRPTCERDLLDLPDVAPELPALPE